MDALVPYLAKLHQQDLLDQAANHRRAKLADASHPNVPAWRRALSGFLASAARSVDPSLEAERSPVPSGRGASALPVC